MRILILNQCFYPDIVATAQYASDLASALAQRGHKVTIVASRRAYSDSDTTFAKEEDWKGCKIIRVPSLALGKQAKWRRAANFGSFFISCALRLIRLQRFDIVLALTTPPLISFVGALFTKIKGGRFLFWVMDLNPDEAVAAGWLGERSSVTKALNLVLNLSLQVSETVVVLDRFMRDRIAAKGVPQDKIRIIPPWSHSDVVRFDGPGRHAFRRRHDLDGKFVVMYSGNHTPCHPLDTVLAAALSTRTLTDIVFCFVGGGSEYAKVKAFANQHGLDNIRCLPYQPLAHLSASLSAADMHLVVMGDPFVGIVHASKIYNIMRIGTPVIYIGPIESHISDIAAEYTDAPVFQVRHGEVDLLRDTILNCVCRTVPNKGMHLASCNFSQETLVKKFADMIEALHAQSPVHEIPRLGVVPSESRPRGNGSTVTGPLVQSQRYTAVK